MSLTRFTHSLPPRREEAAQSTEEESEVDKHTGENFSVEERRFDALDCQLAACAHTCVKGDR